MDHIQDVYKKKPEMISKIWDHITKVNLKVDGKPFQVVYNEDEDELEYHGRSGNETKVGPLIDDMQRLFSKPINDAIRHIETRKDIFKEYKFLTFEVIGGVLLLTAIIDKSGKFVNDPKEIKEIADKLETDVMPCLWEGKLSDEQKTTLMDAISTDIIPTKNEFVEWVKALFGTYKEFPKSLISRSEEFIEGLVFFYNVDGKIVEYKLVDPTYRNLVKDNQNKKQDEEVAKKFEKIYEIFVGWAEENGSALDKNRIKSIELNFINMMKDVKIYNKLMNLGSGLTLHQNDSYFLQLDRVSDDLRKEIKKHGNVYQLLFEKFVKLFYKGKKRAFIISKEFQERVNKLVEKFADYSLNEEFEIEINGMYIIDESLVDDITNAINQIKDKKILHKISNYINSLSTDNKNLLYTWCKLKYNDNRRVDQFYKLLKTALRSSSSFNPFMTLVKMQLNDDLKTLKDPKDNSFVQIDLSKNTINVDLLKMIQSTYKDCGFENDDVWKEIHNISLPGQPTVGNSEILFRVITHPGDDNKFGGDVPSYNHGIEIKDFGSSEAKLGNDKFGNTDAIWDYLKLNKVKNLNSTYFNDDVISHILNVLQDDTDANNFISIFSKIIDNEILKSLGNTPIKDMIDALKGKDIFKFYKIWMSIYLISYGYSENFDVFLTTSERIKNCFNYSWIYINKNKILDTYKYIIDQDVLISDKIRHDSNKKIFITCKK